MQLTRAIPAVWVHTTGTDYNNARAGGYGAFLTDDQQARLERLRQARLLYDGRHREYFLDEGRTQFDFPLVRAGDRQVRMYLTCNVLGLISLKGADLLFGQEPLLVADNAAQQNALARLGERSNLHSLLYACAVDASYEGETFLEACVHEREVHLRQVPADEIFPVGRPGPDSQYNAYARYRIRNAGTDSSPLHLLLEVLYLPGRIERRCYQLDDDGGRREVELSSWIAGTASHDAQSDGTAVSSYSTTPPRQTGVTLAPVTRTGIPFPTITWIPNQLVRCCPVSDYDGAIELQDALNAKNSQVGRVLLKHADPRMVFPEEAFTADGNVRSDHEVFAFSDAKKIPQYITWNAELGHAMADRAFVLNQLLVRTETSPVLLGLKEGAAPDAYRKVRLESFNSLTKAARKAAYWKAGIRRAIAVAQMLENTLPGVRYPQRPIGVTLRDGIPQDDKDTADRLSVLRAAGLISLQRAVEEQLGDPAAVQRELQRLELQAPFTDIPVTSSGTHIPSSGTPGEG
ncbi:phage portal protein [Humisphaera borealis]|uniref:Phage portal protein n=1 Tax=Humisphaera borealis TaxID=2807512 RepID=A0A7M2WPS1_9BACT|nr:phage portal protein [Humisphaera borealis]QOV87413.1 phage portal protein [Humisphaera borealis]